ncbi:predicted protein [Coccidioides posadasii C735 delta SOWgp]|uniref:Uncharacterized protein n=1 Tax=Coccidioides posadasii (strain C735) TaxID=222929 RepID=C5P378_COCP7|nr:predicted protein [Coccidioides posadasii C735 delta SOWgp]EER28766.1 predicted protein [Coccidioides posadasii C735 delta SOWgp]|eukprot:XP_003070911.1 predicted protein [Coccidioides posadasii C735 delta SOWgp]
MCWSSMATTQNLLRDHGWTLHHIFIPSIGICAERNEEERHETCRERQCSHSLYRDREESNSISESICYDWATMLMLHNASYPRPLKSYIKVSADTTLLLILLYGFIFYILYTSCIPDIFLLELLPGCTLNGHIPPAAKKTEVRCNFFDWDGFRPIQILSWCLLIVGVFCTVRINFPQKEKGQTG